jgi:beta-glucosidase
VADVLFGEHDFQGRLSFSWPQDTRPTINHGDADYAPRFPLGFGLRMSDPASDGR